MEKNNKHIIHRINLEINTDNEKQALEIKSNIDLFLRNELFPIIEELFNEATPFNEIQRYESIDIELNLKPDNWLTEIKETIADQLREKLKEIESKSSKLNNDKDWKRIIQDNLSPAAPSTNTTIADQHTPSPGLKMEKIGFQTNIENIIVYFLEFGQLPWYAEPSSIELFTKPNGFNSFFHSPTFIQKLTTLFASQDQPIDRFVAQFDSEIIETFIFQLPCSQNIDKQKIHQKASLLSQKNREIVLKHIIHYAIRSDHKIPEQQSFLSEIQQVSTTKELIIDQLILAEEVLAMFGINFPPTPYSITTNKPSSEMPDTTKDRFKKTPTTNESELTQKNQGVEEKNENGYSDKKYNNLKINEKQEFLSSEENKLTNFGEEAFYIQNAGLIVLHPFLKSFFDRTQCTNSNHRFYDEKRSLATHLLHYLATGIEYEMEYNLLMEKFLCGISFNEPIRRNITLSEPEKAECNELLHSVVQNWPALKNTSSDGLRQMFIQRGGKLIQKENNFQLIVERKVQDILREKLPWNISIVKLPWIKELIFVEW
ncbi:MAG TPA: contractile injection system tape measure protein [Prolixibacteraceae bacterium]|nr:contractile injection system tape measure protein [Prolixibacteraceae bacterium]